VVDRVLQLKLRVFCKSEKMFFIGYACECCNAFACFFCPFDLGVYSRYIGQGIRNSCVNESVCNRKSSCFFRVWGNAQGSQPP
jgi:hypothetical protein